MARMVAPSAVVPHNWPDRGWCPTTKVGRHDQVDRHDESLECWYPRASWMPAARLVNGPRDAHPMGERTADQVREIDGLLGPYAR
jgi:hypothetical protein